jgi:hypothetical protein
MTVESPVRYQAVWKAYSFIVVGLTAASVVLGGFSLLNLVSGLVSLALVLPLIGYAWQRALSLSTDEVVAPFCARPRGSIC